MCIAGWWYGVVGHLETCDGDANHCRCHYSGEFSSALLVYAFVWIVACCVWNLELKADAELLVIEAVVLESRL